MAKQNKSTESVYRVTEVIGTSNQSWEDAAKAAVQTAAGTLRDLRIAEVVKMDVKIEDGKVLEFRTRLQLSFKYRELVLRYNCAVGSNRGPISPRTFSGYLSEHPRRPDE